ncbi:hypothetical protein PPACK8108_LOCUS4919 [Phakopsora pachyrhizi]|uniref:Phosphatidate cytidylyltransferase n=1 Tax=Phakopsora pachyrhizi TaxID=170000 RepID=A0AAV0ARG6_PHAPC|nr:hypothetical protein PPACK8108_LOCUS4919 [Phakopsora pachyrhizi]
MTNEISSEEQIRIEQNRRVTLSSRRGTTKDQKEVEESDGSIETRRGRDLRPVDESSNRPDKEQDDRLIGRVLRRWKVWCLRYELPRKILHSSIGFITLQRWTSNGNPVLIVVWLTRALLVILTADLMRFKSKRFSRLYESLLGFLMRQNERNDWNGVIFYLIGVIISLSTLPLDISVLSILILSWVDTSASVIGRLYGSDSYRLPSPPFSRTKSVAGFIGGLTTGSLTAYAFWSTFVGMGEPYPNGYSWRLVRVLSSIPRRRSNVRSSGLEHESIIGSGGNGGSLGGLVGVGSRSVRILSWVEERIRLSTPDSTLGLVPLSLGCGLISAIAEALNVWGLDDNLILPVLSGWGIWGFMKIF